MSTTKYNVEYFSKYIKETKSVNIYRARGERMRQFRGLQYLPSKDKIDELNVVYNALKTAETRK